MAWPREDGCRELGGDSCSSIASTATACPENIFEGSQSAKVHCGDGGDVSSRLGAGTGFRLRRSVPSTMSKTEPQDLK